MPNDGSHIYDMFIKSCTKKMPQCSIWLLKPREFEKIARAIENDLPLSEKELILNMGDVVIWVVRTLVGSEYVYSEIRWEEYR
jgi:hypothetical protein